MANTNPAPRYTIEGESLTANEIVDRAVALSKNKVKPTTVRQRLLTGGKRTWKALSLSGAEALRAARSTFATSHAEFFKNDQKKREDARKAAALKAKKEKASSAQGRYEKTQAELEVLREKCQAENEEKANKQRAKAAAAQPAVRTDPLS